MSGVATEPVLAAELWLSFVCLVRSYASVAGLHGGQPVEVLVAAEMIELSAGAVECAMLFDSQNGAAVWTLRTGAQEAAAGRFALRPDGRIEQDGRMHEMDTVAIDTVARVRDWARAGKKGSQ